MCDVNGQVGADTHAKDNPFVGGHSMDECRKTARTLFGQEVFSEIPTLLAFTLFHPPEKGRFSLARQDV
jgi:hypothetical protein